MKARAVVPSYAGLGRRGPVMACAILFGLLAGGAPMARDQMPPENQYQVPDFLRDRVPLLSSQTAMLTLAEAIGVQEIMGKRLDALDEDNENDNGAPFPPPNVGIGVHPSKHENEPTVAANPRRKRRLVAGSHFFGPPPPAGNRCVAYTSSNGGATWSGPVPMPQLTPASECSDPVLAYAPNGTRVYYAYMDIRPPIFTPPSTLRIQGLDILVSYSDNDGATWTGPVVALDGVDTVINTGTGEVITPGFDYDKPWIAAHVPAGDDDGDDDNGDQGNAKFAYVTATRFDNFAPGNCHIAFTRSSNKGGAWSAPAIVDSSSGGCGNPIVVQGSRPAGGRGDNVVVAWYNSGSDGWLNGSFSIRTRRSQNNGSTWAATVNAVTDSYEAPFWLGPFVAYHRWWACMFPDIEIDARGRAHIVYTHDPAQNPLPGFSNTPEDGDVRYIRSTTSSYSAWSAPRTLNDDGLIRAQGYAAIDAGGDEDDGGVHVLWEDHRLSGVDNLYFDMFYTTKDDDGGWSANSRITSDFSISDFVFIGDYNDITLIGGRGEDQDNGNEDNDNGRCVYGVWTDRRHQVSIFAMEDNVFGARICGGDLE